MNLMKVVVVGITAVVAALCEGGEKMDVYCKYCGQSAGSIQALVNGRCPRHPTGFAKGPHTPVR